MVATVIVAVVLLLVVAETVRGFLKWRSGGQKDALAGLGGAIPCVAYLIRNHVSEYFLLTFLLVGLTVAWAGSWLWRGGARQLTPARVVLPTGTRAGARGCSWLYWRLTPWLLC
jgi:hypothetical protein